MICGMKLCRRPSWMKKDSNRVKMTSVCSTNLGFSSFSTSTSNAGLAVKNPIDIDELLVNLRAKGFEMTRESTFAEFLGIKFIKNETTGAITLTQKGLINRIIEATGMENCNPNWVPAAREGLGIDPNGEPMNESWRSYPPIHCWHVLALVPFDKLSHRHCVCGIPRSRSILSCTKEITRRRCEDNRSLDTYIEHATKETLCYPPEAYLGLIRGRRLCGSLPARSICKPNKRQVSNWIHYYAR